MTEAYLKRNHSNRFSTVKSCPKRKELLQEQMVSPLNGSKCLGNKQAVLYELLWKTDEAGMLPGVCHKLCPMPKSDKVL